MKLLKLLKNKSEYQFEESAEIVYDGKGYYYRIPKFTIVSIKYTLDIVKL